MNLQDDPGTVFREIMPDTTPPPAAFDLDRIISDGYKARRRHRAVLGGASATSVAAIVGVLVFSVAGLPGGGSDEAEDHDVPAATEDFDYANAGYPLPGPDGYGDPAVAEALTEAGRAAFGDLLIATGLFEASDFVTVVNDPTEEEIQQFAEEFGLSYEQAEAELTVVEDDGLFVFTGEMTPGNYGQVQLLGYEALAFAGGGADGDDPGRLLLEVETLLPGGWTAEPGPTSQQYFPQHLIDDAESDFTTTELDDGRVLYTADRECELALAVVYPNGSALRATWEALCGPEGEEVPVDPEALEAAVLAMPQIDYDTTNLHEIDPIEVPTGWLAGDAGWWTWAEDSAQVTRNDVQTALDELAPGGEVYEPSASPTPDAYWDEDTVALRQYVMTGSLPYESVLDTTVGDVPFDLTYTLPGGWLPGFSDADANGPYLSDCNRYFTCIESEVNGRTAFIAEKRLTHEADGSGAAGWFEGEYEVTVVDPDGWAVSVWMQFGNEDFALSAEALAAIVAQLPAPTYDRDMEPVVPE
ncbi:hypothetical protein [Glycomyces albidus]|uniref:Uncharacterized protein n=1 Tax=Glycomyces albidus TaxID=2656774 RepID=A0A6L5G5V9_9ACTN|nr:hypothetical protein [Glycomyces albidus]MQM25027.1 hypothetical protein [Glycomyces albidus]